MKRMWKSKENSKEKKKKEKKKGIKRKRIKEKSFYMIASFLGDVGVIWCNSLGDSHFQTYVIDNVELHLIFIKISHF